MILAGVMIGFVLVGGIIYGTVGRTYFENQKIASIENRVDSFIENKYTNAIKDGVTVDQVSDIQKDIDNISDNSKKIRLQNKVQAIVTQAKLQSDLKAQIKKFSEAEKLEDVSLDDLKNAISKAQGILNVKVRNNLIKDGNDTLDKVEYATYTLAEAQKMTGDNPGLYYTVEGLNESVAYPETKKEVDKLLEKAKKEIDKEKSSTDEQKTAKKNAAIQEAQKGSTYSFTKGSSTSTKMKANEYQIFNKVLTNNSLAGQKFLGVEDGKVVVYTTELNSGIVSVKEIVTVEYTTARISTPQVFSHFSVFNSSINADNYTIGTQQSNDVVISSNGFETLKNSLR